jgi:hypothetical protein
MEGYATNIYVYVSRLQKKNAPFASRIAVRRAALVGFVFFCASGGVDVGKMRHGVAEGDGESDGGR